MTTLHSHLQDAASAELTESPAPARIVEGDPTCAEWVIVDTPDLEIGVWEVTPGVFDSVKQGIGEVVVFLFGKGRIEHADGSVSPIAPGAVVEFLPGWTGRWVVEETTRKVYTIYSASAAS
ncbi:cupin domain-containing protein [Salinibacterium soli]|uniref:Cupin domain-containing protein n=1 Tax=Antiquaquibacter soli TaxID=3064523 RepID=A0ABT9BNP7_9MICO|nr:cupin domain-containing protein [Protaetiibacter sp. WY-16]MDO7882662.1 cupin domain-containing protein [Protaetiibacter sp. WY-16]